MELQKELCMFSQAAIKNSMDLIPFYYSLQIFLVLEDNFNPDSSHVIAALIKRFYDAKIKKQKEVIVWGETVMLLEIFVTLMMLQKELY